MIVPFLSLFDQVHDRLVQERLGVHVLGGDEQPQVSPGLQFRDGPLPLLERRPEAVWPRRVGADRQHPHVLRVREQGAELPGLAQDA